MGATRVEGRLQGTPVKGTRILSVSLGGNAARVDDADGRREDTGAENEVVWTVKFRKNYGKIRNGWRIWCGYIKYFFRY